MNAITIQKLSERAFEILAERARAHRQSIEDEAAAILEEAVTTQTQGDSRRRIVDRIAAMTPKGLVQTDSTQLIREDRDR